MSADDPVPADETGFDRLLGFTIPGRNARGRVIRLGPVLDEILSAHAYPPAARGLLAEALVLTALIGGLLKDAGGQLTMQAQASGGAVSLLVCDFRDGELRGYLQFDEKRLARLGANPRIENLFGEGYLAITFEPGGTEQRFQGIVPLEGASLGEACEIYFSRSEQVPTLIRLAVRCDAAHCVAGGLLVQYLPESEEGRERLHAQSDYPEWEHVAALAGSTRHDELIDPTLSLDALIWRLFHEEPEVRVLRGSPLSRGCRCSIEHYEQILARFPEEDRAEMRDESGDIVVDCAFCSRLFKIAI